MSDTDPNAASASSTPAKSGPSNAVLAVVVVLILVILGGGGWLVYDKVIKSDSSSANLPDTVLPATTIGVATVDANPSLSEKLNLLKFIGKFPSLKGRVSIGAQDDPRAWVVTQLLKSSHCPALSYASDFRPWLGDHFALGAVDVGAQDPAPVAALQATNISAAESTLKKIVTCTSTHDFFFKAVGSYVVASDSQAHLTAIVNATTSAPLSGDPHYRKWTSAVGEPGLLNFYVAPRALKMLVNAVGAVPACDQDVLTKALSKFTGIAGKLTATSDGLELTARVGTNSSVASGAALGQEVGQLPGDTALVLGIAPSTGAKSGELGGLPTACKNDNGGFPSPSSMMTLIQQRTGLALPGDLNTLLGKAFVLSLGGNAPSDLSEIQGPSAVPLGIEVQGDTAKIQAILTRVQRHLGISLAQMGLVEKVANGRLILSTNADYATAISAPGALGSDPVFKATVPGAGKAQAVVFIRIDSAWRTAILNSVGNPGDPAASSAAADTAGLAAFGIAAWVDNGAVVVDVKLTTK